MTISGVYTISFLDRKYYVGESEDVYRRLNGHRNDLRINKHPNRYLQAAWNKHGDESFLFELLEECPSYLTKSLEHYWCNMLNSHNKEYGYNLLPTHPEGKRKVSKEMKALISKSLIEYYEKGGVHKGRGKKHSLEVRKRISEAATGRKQSKEHIKKRGESIRKTKEKKGCWHTEEVKLIIGQKNKGRRRPDCITRFGKSILQYDLNGNFIKEWETISSACKYFNIQTSLLCEVLKEKPGRKTAGGYKWKYKLLMNNEE